MKKVKRGEIIYRKLEPTLLKEQGSFVAIDTDSGDYFVAKDALDACALGRQKHPSKQFYLKRIGAKSTFVVGAL